MMTLIQLVIAVILVGFNTGALADDTGTEKCYGVAKAGLNDCDINVTTCDKSVIDGDPNYYLNVPKGLCDKIVGGMTTLGSGPQPGAGLKSVPLAPPAGPTAAPTTIPTPGATPSANPTIPAPASPATPPAQPAMPPASTPAGTPATSQNR